MPALIKQIFAIKTRTCVLLLKVKTLNGCKLSALIFTPELTYSNLIHAISVASNQILLGINSKKIEIGDSIKAHPQEKDNQE